MSTTNSAEKFLHDELKVQIAKLINRGLQKIYDEIFKNDEKNRLTITEIYNLLAEPPKREMGHYAFPCFPLAKTLKKGPPQISGELASICENILNENHQDFSFIESGKQVGPYFNIFIQEGNFAKDLLGKIKSGEFFSKKFQSFAPKTMIEYFQPNTHKEVHVGHLRNLALGESVINMHKYCGYPIVAVTYPGDSGTHVAKVLWYFKNHNPEIPDEVKTGEVDRGEWLGGIYNSANKMLEDERGTDKEDQNRKELTDILKEIHDGKGEYFDLWNETREWSLEHMKSITNWAGVTFDKWFFESQVDSSSLDYAQELYAQGLLTKDDGAIGMDLKEEKLGFCILIKSDGNGLYATKDVELARLKFEEDEIQKSIYVVDKRQSYHFKQVFKTLEKIGFPQAKNCYHLEYEFVTLPGGAMSSRKGNIVSARSLINEMQELIKEKYLSRYEDWSQQEKNETAYAVSLGAIKYGMLCIEPNKEIVFDMEAWLKLDGESGPYIQYAHARISSLLEKFGEIQIGEEDFKLLEKPTEKELVFRLGQFNNVAEIACDQYKISTLCSYLYNLSKLYSSFYAECPVMTAETDGLKNLRAYLSACTAEVLKQGLGLIGIPAPKRM